MFFDMNQFWCRVGSHKQTRSDVRFVRAVLPVALVSKGGTLTVYYDYYQMELLERKCVCCKNKSHLLVSYDCYRGGHFTATIGHREHNKESFFQFYEEEWFEYLTSCFKHAHPNEQAALFEPISLEEAREIAASITGSLNVNPIHEGFQSDIDGTNHIELLVGQWFESPELGMNFCKHNKAGRFKWGG